MPVVVYVTVYVPDRLVARSISPVVAFANIKPAVEVNCPAAEVVATGLDPVVQIVFEA